MDPAATGPNPSQGNSDPEQPTRHRTGSHASLALVTDMRALLASGTGDVSVKFTDGETTAHKAILGARSPVMRAMWSSQMQEAQTQSVEMQCCQESGMAFLDFVYTGELRPGWPTTLEAVSDMGVLADYYQVADLSAAFGPENCENLRDKVFEPGYSAGEFWTKTIEFLVRPRLIEKMRYRLLESFVENAELSWGDDLFLALCIGCHHGAHDVEEECLSIVRRHFRAKSDSTRDSDSVDDCPFKQEFNDRRLRTCRRRSSERTVLRCFIKFQATVLEVLHHRPRCSAPPTQNKMHQNRVQISVQEHLSEIAARVLAIAEMEPRPDEEDSDSSGEEEGEEDSSF